MKDRYGRNIDYARISLTNRCNLKCIYCMPEENVIYSGGKNLNTDEILTIIRALVFNGITKIRFTGGEPLLYEDIEGLIRETSTIGGIKDVSLTTNGVLLKKMAQELKAAGLNRININLGSLNAKNYSKITRGGNLDIVLEGIEEAIKLGFDPIKINMVVIKGINDNEIDEFIRLSEKLPVHIRFIELMPLGEGKKYYDNDGRFKFSEILKRHHELSRLKVVDGISVIYGGTGIKNSIGFIQPISDKFCASCNRIRITSDGKIKPCLHSDEEVDLLNHLRNDEKLIKTIGNAILTKPHEHTLDIENVSRSKRRMYEIGG